MLPRRKPPTGLGSRGHRTKKIENTAGEQPAIDGRWTQALSIGPEQVHEYAGVRSRVGLHHPLVAHSEAMRRHGRLLDREQDLHEGDAGRYQAPLPRELGMQTVELLLDHVAGEPERREQLHHHLG